MNRIEKEGLLAWCRAATKAELKAAIAEQLDLRARLKEQRARDLSGVIDRLTVLVGIWKLRTGEDVIHKGEVATVDRVGDLWIRAISSGPNLSRWRESQPEPEPKAKPRSKFEERADRLLEAARALRAEGKDLTVPALCERLGGGWHPSSVRSLIHALRKAGRFDWPIVRATSNVPCHLIGLASPGPKERRAPAPKTAEARGGTRSGGAEEQDGGGDGETWVDLVDLGFGGWEGTATGRVRRSPGYIHLGPRPPKVPAGTELFPNKASSLYGLITSGPVPRTRSITPFAVGKHVAAKLGLPIPRHLDGRRHRRNGKLVPALRAG